MQSTPPQNVHLVHAYRHTTPEEQQKIAHQKGIISNPNVDSYIKNVLNQQFAELALSDVDNQFPLHIELISGGPTIAETINEKIEQIVQSVSRKHVSPYLEFGASAPATTMEQGAPQLHSVPLEEGLHNKLLEITGKISEGTAQGVVYKVDLFPEAQLINTSVFHNASGVKKDVPAVIKKSPIYNPHLWLKRHGLLQIKTIADLYGEETFQIPELIQKFQQIQKYGRISNSEINAVLHDNKYMKELKQTLLQEYNNLSNEAYADAIGYFLGSKLVDTTLSPFYPLLYGTFRANDSGYFPKEDTTVFGPGINEKFPVEVVIMQPLNGDLNGLIKSNWFHVNPQSKGIGILDYDKVMSLFAQVVFGLAIGQNYFGLVHNDSHGGNLMYQDVESNKNLYYRKGDTYYRVPTYGKEFKQIDFGRATYDIGAERLGSTVQRDIIKNWNLKGMNNDLLRIVSVFVSTQRLANQLKNANQQNPFFAFARHVLSCGNNGKTIFNRIEECEDMHRDPTKSNQYNKDMADWCHQQEFSINPYLDGSDCGNAVPKENFDFFDQFVVDRSSVPSNAIVYPLP